VCVCSFVNEAAHKKSETYSREVAEIHILAVVEKTSVSMYVCYVCVSMTEKVCVCACVCVCDNGVCQKKK